MGTHRGSRAARRLWLTLLIAGAALAPASMLVARGSDGADIAHARTSFDTARSALHEFVAVAPAAPRVAPVKSGRVGLLAAPATAASVLLLGVLRISETRRRLGVRFAALGPSDPRGPPHSSALG